MTEFIIYAAIAGIGVAIPAGPLGCFIVWRGMAYLGDTLAHSALLGIAFGIWLNLDLNIAATAIPGVIAVIIAFSGRSKNLSHDTLLGILSHSTLALGLVLISFVEGLRVDILSLLFGDILSVSSEDLLVIYSIGSVIVVFLVLSWRSILNITVNAELAEIDGVNVVAARTTLMLMIATIIAIAMKVVGVLLITALLIIPAAASRNISRTPEQMALAATVIAISSVLLGLVMSWSLDSPAGPSIIVCSASLFLALGLVGEKTQA